MCVAALALAHRTFDAHRLRAPLTFHGRAVSDKATADAIEKSTVKLAAKVALLWREGVVPVTASEPLRVPMIHAATALIDALERRPGDIVPATSSEALKACAVVLVDIIKPFMKVGARAPPSHAHPHTQPGTRKHTNACIHHKVHFHCVPAMRYTGLCVHMCTHLHTRAGKELEACGGAGRVLLVRVISLLLVQQRGAAQGA